MATDRQVEANRQNAAKSTGPRTAGGKEAVSGNSIRHGLRSRKLILKGEDPAEFAQLAGDLESEWQPNSATESYYLQQMAIAQWKLVRVEVAEANLYDEPQNAREQIVLLDRIWQAQQRFERSFSRAQRELERLQQARSQSEPAFPIQPDTSPQETTPDNASHSPISNQPLPTAALPSRSSASCSLRKRKSWLERTSLNWTPRRSISSGKSSATAPTGTRRCIPGFLKTAGPAISAAPLARKRARLMINLTTHPRLKAPQPR